MNRMSDSYNITLVRPTTGFTGNIKWRNEIYLIESQPGGKAVWKGGAPNEVVCGQSCNPM